MLVLLLLLLLLHLLLIGVAASAPAAAYYLCFWSWLMVPMIAALPATCASFATGLCADAAFRCCCCLNSSIAADPELFPVGRSALIDQFFVVSPSNAK